LIALYNKRSRDVEMKAFELHHVEVSNGSLCGERYGRILA